MLHLIPFFHYLYYHTISYPAQITAYTCKKRLFIFILFNILSSNVTYCLTFSTLPTCTSTIYICYLY